VLRLGRDCSTAIAACGSVQWQLVRYCVMQLMFLAANANGKLQLLEHMCTLQAGAPPAAVLKTLAVRRESRAAAAALQINSSSNTDNSSARRGSKEWQLAGTATADDQVSEISIKSEVLLPGTGGRRVTAAAVVSGITVSGGATAYDATDEGRKAAQGNKTAATAFDGTALAAAQGQ
jgi:hypothetical protein